MAIDPHAIAERIIRDHVGELDSIDTHALALGYLPDDLSDEMLLVDLTRQIGELINAATVTVTWPDQAVANATQPDPETNRLVEQFVRNHIAVSTTTAAHEHPCCAVAAEIKQLYAAVNTYEAQNDKLTAQVEQLRAKLDRQLTTSVEDTTDLRRTIRRVREVSHQRRETTDPTTPLRDQLAAIEHGRWAHWQQYMHGVCQRNDDGTLTIPAHLAQRWERQIATQYADLDDAERASDLRQVDRYWHLVCDVARPDGWESVRALQAAYDDVSARWTAVLDALAAAGVSTVAELVEQRDQARSEVDRLQKLTERTAREAKQDRSRAQFAEAGRNALAKEYAGRCIERDQARDQVVELSGRIAELNGRVDAYAREIASAVSGRLTAEARLAAIKRADIGIGWWRDSHNGESMWLGHAVAENVICAKSPIIEIESGRNWIAIVDAVVAHQCEAGA